MLVWAGDGWSKRKDASGFIRRVAQLPGVKVTDSVESKIQRLSAVMGTGDGQAGGPAPTKQDENGTLADGGIPEETILCQALLEAKMWKVYSTSEGMEN